MQVIINEQVTSQALLIHQQLFFKMNIQRQCPGGRGQRQQQHYQHRSLIAARGWSSPQAYRRHKRREEQQYAQ